MKKLAFFSFLILTVSCKQDKKENQTTSAQSFDYLLGNWARTNDEAGQKTFESWAKENDTVYNGVCYTLKSNDTIWQENVRLSKSGNDWNYAVTPKGETTVTPFKLTKMDSGGFVCRNEKNKFPKQIQYVVSADKIHAVISGDGDMQVPFEFDRVK